MRKIVFILFFLSVASLLSAQTVLSTAASRVVYRGYNYANANGGVSYAYASNDASYTSAYIGSRLAFRGKLVRAESVEAYKAIREVL